MTGRGAPLSAGSSPSFFTVMVERCTFHNSSGAPQDPQNCVPLGTGLPQRGQGVVLVETGAAAERAGFFAAARSLTYPRTK